MDISRMVASRIGGKLESYKALQGTT